MPAIIFRIFCKFTSKVDNAAAGAALYYRFQCGGTLQVQANIGQELGHSIVWERFALGINKLGKMSLLLPFESEIDRSLRDYSFKLAPREMPREADPVISKGPQFLTSTQPLFKLSGN